MHIIILLLKNISYIRIIPSIFLYYIHFITMNNYIDDIPMFLIPYYTYIYIYIYINKVGDANSQ